MKTKILGTGLAGLVGSRIVELLGDGFDFENLSFDQGFDITKPETIESKIASSDASVLIHLAAFTDVGAAWKENGNKEGLCYQINVEGTKNIADLCAKHNKYLIHFSTDFVFDGEKEEPYTEEDLPNPIDWYGKTKYWAEEEVKNSGCKSCITRISFPFRANYSLKKDFIAKMIDGFKTGSLYPQFNDEIITPTFVDDIAWGIKEVLERKPEGIVHLTGPSFITPFELSKLVAQTFGLDGNLIKEGSLLEYLKNNPNSRPYPRCLKISNTKAREVLGIEMKTIVKALSELSTSLTP
ncbi:MAG: SDR family oxidoreductase [Patescibacteria group bacterium]|jgi:dTDP-4-dehydrorhamnose reductase